MGQTSKVRASRSLFVPTYPVLVEPRSWRGASPTPGGRDRLRRAGGLEERKCFAALWAPAIVRPHPAADVGTTVYQCGLGRAIPPADRYGTCRTRSCRDVRPRRLRPGG